MSPASQLGDPVSQYRDAASHLEGPVSHIRDEAAHTMSHERDDGVVSPSCARRGSALLLSASGRKNSRRHATNTKQMTELSIIGEYLWEHFGRVFFYISISRKKGERNMVMKEACPKC